MRGPEGPRRGPELGEGLNNSWKAKVFKKSEGPSQQSCQGIAGRNHRQSHSEFPPTLVNWDHENDDVIKHFFDQIVNVNEFKKP